MDLNLVLFAFSGAITIRYGLILWQIHNEGINISFKMKYQYELKGTPIQKRRKYKLGLTLVWITVIFCSLVAAVTAALMIKQL